MKAKEPKASKKKTQEAKNILIGEELNEFLIKLGSANNVGIRRKVLAIKKFLKEKLNIEFATEQMQQQFLDWQVKRISNYSYTKEEKTMPLRPALIKALIDDFSQNHPSEPVSENWHEELSAKLKNSLAFKASLDQYETKTYSMIGKIIFEEENGKESNVEFDISAVKI